MPLEKKKLSIPFQDLEKRTDEVKNKIGEFEKLDNIARNTFGKFSKRKGVEKIVDTDDKTTSIISTDNRIVSVINNRRHQAFSPELDDLSDTGLTLGADTNTAFFGPSTSDAWVFTMSHASDVNLKARLVSEDDSAFPIEDFGIQVQAIDENGFVFDELGEIRSGQGGTWGMDSAVIRGEPYIFSITDTVNLRVWRYNTTTQKIELTNISLTTNGRVPSFPGNLGLAVAINTAETFMVVTYSNNYSSIDISTAIDVTPWTEIDSATKTDSGATTDTVFDGLYDATKDQYIFAIGKDGTDGTEVNGYSLVGLNGSGAITSQSQSYPVTTLFSARNGCVVITDDDLKTYFYFSRAQVGAGTGSQNRIARMELDNTLVTTKVWQEWLHNYQLNAKGFIDDNAIYIPVVPAAYTNSDTSFYPVLSFGKRGWGSIVFDNLDSTRGVTTNDVPEDKTPILSSAGRFYYQTYKVWIGKEHNVLGKMMSRQIPLGNKVFRTVLPEDDEFLLRTGAVESQSVGRFFDLTLDVSQQGRTWNGESFIEGGKPTIFDGRDWLNAGFSHDPIIIGGQTSGLVLPAGTYFYRYIYEVKDSAGNTWQSAPSQQIRWDTTDQGLFTPSFFVITSNFDFLDRSEGVELKLFRATQTTGTFHFCGITIQEQAADEIVDITGLTDTILTEADLITQEVLYTEGGVIENASAPPTNITTFFKERILAVESTTPTRIWFTKQVEGGFSPSFAGEFTLDIAGERSFEDGITSIVEMYERMVIFAREAIVVIGGDGPADTGAQNDFTSPQTVSSTLGCINHRATIATNIGVFFASNDGMYLLDRGLTTHFIGAAIYDKDLSTINATVIIADQSEIRWTTSTDECFVYNMASKKWTVFKNYTSKGSMLHKRTHTILKSDGIYQEVGTFQDEGDVAISMSLETSWLHENANQGFMRCNRFQLIGEFKSNHDVTIEVAYDYDDTDFDTYTFTPDSAKPYQFDLHLKRQKCQSIKFRITDIPSAPFGESASFSDFYLEASVKKTSMVFPVDRKIKAT